MQAAPKVRISIYSTVLVEDLTIRDAKHCGEYRDKIESEIES